MKDKNQDILQKVIAQLPEYEPNESVWNAIENRLPLLALNSYEPPESVWQNIDNQLVIPKNHTLPISNYPLTITHYLYLAAASMALLAIICFQMFFKNTGNSDISLHISTEIIDKQLINNNLQVTDKAFDMVETFCKNALATCQEPEFKQLKQELDELTEAQQYLKNALTAYNSDPDLVAQLAQLENERSGILKKMIERM